MTIDTTISDLSYAIKKADGDQKYFSKDYVTQEKAQRAYDTIKEWMEDYPLLSCVSHLEILDREARAITRDVMRPGDPRWAVRGVINFKGEPLEDEQKITIDSE